MPRTWTSHSHTLPSMVLPPLASLTSSCLPAPVPPAYLPLPRLHTCPFPTCPCPPPAPQALLNSSHMYMEAKQHFGSYGIKVEGLSYDFAAIQKQKDTVVAGLTKGIEGLFKKNKVRHMAPYG